ncbi:MAG: DUF5615 family PIN-like protein [Coleofasciculus sp. F4-SAH-05]
MKIWIDAQLPPALAQWLIDIFGLEASALRDLGLRDVQDIEIFEAARAEKANKPLSKPLSCKERGFELSPFRAIKPRKRSRVIITL